MDWSVFQIIRINLAEIVPFTYQECFFSAKKSYYMNSRKKIFQVICTIFLLKNNFERLTK